MRIELRDFAGARAPATDCARAFFLALVCVVVSILAGCGNETATPESAAEFIERATRLSNAGDVNGAVIELKNALQRDPESTEARWQLGNNYLKLYEGALAEAQFNRLRANAVERAGLDGAYFRALLLQARYDDVLKGALGNDEPAVLTALGEANLGISDFQSGPRAAEYRKAYIDTARSLFNRAIADDPSHHRAYLGLARVALWEKQFDIASELIDKAESIDPAGVGAPVLAGMLNQLTANPAAAEVAYRTALERSSGDLLAQIGLLRVLIAQQKTQEALNTSRRLIREHPQLPLASYLHAYALLQNDAPDQAIGVLQKSLARNPDSRESSRLLVTTLIRLEKYEQALALTTDLLNRGADEGFARRALAEINLKRGNVDAGMAALRKLPNDYKALELLGRAHIGLGNDERGAWYLEQAERVAAAEATARGTAPTSLWANFLREKIETGAYTSAVAEAERMLEVRPYDPDAHYAAGITYLAAGDEEAARKAFHAALRLEPAHVRSLLSLADLDAADGKFEVATLMYERALEADRTNVRAHVGLARIEARSGANTMAEIRLKEVVDGPEPSVPALLELANLAREAGDETATMRYLQEAAELDTETANASFRLAKYQFDRGNRDGAKRAVNKALDAEPGHEGARLLLSEILYRDGDHTGAEREVYKLAMTRPDNPDAQRALAIAKLRRNDQAGARKALQKVFALEPHHAPGLATLAELELKARDYAAAETAARRLIEIAPNQALGYKLLGDATLAQNAPDRAAEQYGIARTKAGGEVYAVRDQFALAAAWQRAGRVADAERAYREILAIEADNADALNELAWLLHVGGQADAVQVAERAYALKPGNPAIADTLAWILIASDDEQDVSRGVTILRKASAAVPREPAIRFHLASGLAKLGDPIAALEQLDALPETANFPDREAARELRRQIAASQQ